MVCPIMGHAAIRELCRYWNEPSGALRPQTATTSSHPPFVALLPTHLVEDACDVLES
jgi:hypothetical protein